VITSLATLASRSFGFLETSHGFRSVLSTETIVRWETNQVFVQVQYDAHRSYEVGLEIGQLRCDAMTLGPPFSLSEMLGVAGFALAKRPFFQTSTEERLMLALEQMARLLVRYGAKLLQNDDEAFAALGRQRDEDCDAYAEEKSLKSMREAAEKAWHDHDYKTVVDLYRVHVGHLTPAETKRYEIALKRV
jgi:hypothetical protein